MKLGKTDSAAKQIIIEMGIKWNTLPKDVVGLGLGDFQWYQASEIGMLVG
ncbi:MAG: hypothetical protein R8K48_10105 [Gallionella sp.]